MVIFDEYGKMPSDGTWLIVPRSNQRGFTVTQFCKNRSGRFVFFLYTAEQILVLMEKAKKHTVRIRYAKHHPF